MPSILEEAFQSPQDRAARRENVAVGFGGWLYWWRCSNSGCRSHLSIHGLKEPKTLQ